MPDLDDDVPDLAGEDEPASAAEPEEEEEEEEEEEDDPERMPEVTELPRVPLGCSLYKRRLIGFGPPQPLT